MSLRARGALLLSTPFFFFNDTATTEIYTLSLHDALPISLGTGDGPPVDSDEWASRQAGRGCWPAHLMVVVDRANAAAGLQPYAWSKFSSRQRGTGNVVGIEEIGSVRRGYRRRQRPWPRYRSCARRQGLHRLRYGIRCRGGPRSEAGIRRPRQPHRLRHH